MIRYERDGRWCEVGDMRQTYFEGEPCYALDGTGDHDFYVGDTAVLLSMEEHQGGWTIRYRPGDANFLEFANELIRLDAWGK